MKAFDYIFNLSVSEKGYKVFFQAVIVLIGVYLGTLVFISKTIIPIESEAHKLFYLVEQELGSDIDSIENMNCDIESKAYANCELAKYTKRTAETILDTSEAFTMLLRTLIYIFSTCALLSLFCHPFLHKP